LSVALPRTIANGDDVDSDGHGAVADHPQFFSGFATEVDDATFNEGPAVIDADEDAFAVGERGDEDFAGKWERGVGGVDVPWVDTFADGSFATDHAEDGGFIVIASDARLGETQGFIDAHGSVLTASHFVAFG
jgi:hypothetical protein